VIIGEKVYKKTLADTMAKYSVHQLHKDSARATLRRRKAGKKKQEFICIGFRD